MKARPSLRFSRPGQDLFLGVNQILISSARMAPRVKNSPCIGLVSFVMVFSPPAWYVLRNVIYEFPFSRFDICQILRFGLLIHVP